MITQKDIVSCLVQAAKHWNTDNQLLQAAIARTYANNSWLTPENYNEAISYWQNQLTEHKLNNFVNNESFAAKAKNIGIIMAGNIPMVGFHDLLCVLLTGHKAVIKVSSDDKFIIPYLTKTITECNEEIGRRIQFVERVSNIDAVIATGSNNSFRYFEQYFKEIPRLLRKNRKSIAILDGSESKEELRLLAKDVFQYFGLGCRNVCYLLLPDTMKLPTVLDEFMQYKEIGNHNKYANNYTYHRALLLMNNEQHLDTGFLLPKEREDIHTPLACLHYGFYKTTADIDAFLLRNKEQIQCIVGNYCEVKTTQYGESQNPDLQEFADNINTIEFLANL